ncbi:MAG: tetratricopeptide repeat protein [Chloroflexi bacterium]|nr:tetratricopeptide repeat protein [Chloroflexota bacterium]MCL5274778.1 tetratricopeptide repeat protein [Chloroflexota bacterium]
MLYDTISFGSWHKRRRKALGLTQENLASLIGCSTVTVKKIESDDLQPSVQLAELIAGRLQIPLAERSQFVSWARGGRTPNPLDSLETPWHRQAATQAVPRRTSSLPAQLTSMVGRKTEIDAAITLLHQADTRILTLTGPPGIGKTRLSVHLAASIQPGFIDGVWFVPLASIHDPALVTSAIAQILGVRELPGIPLLNTLQEYLRDKQLLLILDNFEHVIKATHVVQELLSSAAAVKFMVTSREVLRLYGEQEFPVPPLGLPDPRRLPPLDILRFCPAVALFVERARAIKPDFELTPENAKDIAEICAWLDGLPLAIEMAAARVKWLSPRVLRSRLSQRLVLLTSGPRDVTARQQTLRSAIDWSYELLNPAERALFARFAVFVNGADSVAAQSILDTSVALDDAAVVIQLADAPRSEVVDIVRSLTDKSLLRVSMPEGANAEPRFSMLDTIREYATDKLMISGELPLMRHRHLAYYAKWAESAEPRLHGRDQIDWLDHFEDEHDNLRTALNWGLLHNGAGWQAALRLSSALGWFWRVHGHLTEGLKYLLAILQLPESAGESLQRAKALSAAGLLAYYRAEYAQAQALYEESVAIGRAAGNNAVLAFALHGLGDVCWYQGNQVRALALHQESVALYRALGYQWGTAIALAGLAAILGYQGDYKASRAMFEESLAMSAAIGDKWAAAYSLWSLGDVTYALGDYQGARALYQQSLPIARELGDKPNIAFVLAKLAGLAMQQGDMDHLGEFASEALLLFREMGDKWQPPFLLRMQSYVALHNNRIAEATALCEESLALNRALGDERGVIACLLALACVHVADGGNGHLVHAARLFGAVGALLAGNESRLLPPDERCYTIHLAALQAKLDRASFQTAYAEGNAMNLAQAMALALTKPSAA